MVQGTRVRHTEAREGRSQALHRWSFGRRHLSQRALKHLKHVLTKGWACRRRRVRWVIPNRRWNRRLFLAWNGCDSVVRELPGFLDRLLRCGFRLLEGRGRHGLACLGVACINGTARDTTKRRAWVDARNEGNPRWWSLWDRRWHVRGLEDFRRLSTCLNGCEILHPS